MKFNVRSLLVLLFSASFLISCGGGGGGGGGSSSSDSENPFTLSVIDSTGDVGLFSSITTGSIHILYYDNDNFNLKYASASSASGPWTIDNTIDTSGNQVGEFFNSIFLDSSGYVHVTYYDIEASLLKYATNATGSWVVEDDLDTSGDDVGMYSSAAIDSTGNIHISYYNSNTGEIKYVTGTAGSWGVPDSFDNIGASLGLDRSLISLAIDSSNKVHIAYYDSNTGNLKYTNNVSDTLDKKVTTIDTGGVGLAVHLAIGPSDDSVHISYNDDTNADLKYATCSADCKTALNWTKEIVDGENDAGNYTSIAVDTNGIVHISYHEFTNDTLKYASGTSGSFSTEVVDDSTGVGDYTSIAVDASRVHISYYDDTNGALKYATRAK